MLCSCGKSRPSTYEICYYFLFLCVSWIYRRCYGCSGLRPLAGPEAWLRRATDQPEGQGRGLESGPDDPGGGCRGQQHTAHAAGGGVERCLTDMFITGGEIFSLEV